MITLRYLGQIAVTIVMVGVLACVQGCGESLVNRFSFHPQSGVQVDPESFFAPIENVFMTTQDNVKIHGFYIPREGATRAILFLHGNAGNASHRLHDAVKLWKLGATVLLLDYRGFGLSDGKPSEKGVYRDGGVGLKYLTHDRGFPMERIFIFGRSIGTAVAVEIAQDQPVAGVILASPMSSGNDVARESGLGWLTFSVGEPFDSASKIEKLKAPLLVFHGDWDKVIPKHLGEKLFARARVEKRFVMMEGAGHNDLIRSNEKLFFSNVDEFMKAHAPEKNLKSDIIVDSFPIRIAKSAYFNPGSESINDGSVPVLDSVAQTLKSHDEIQRILVVGHATDDEGTDEKKKKLSMARAVSVVNHLESRGVPRSKMREIGLSDACNVNTTSDAHDSAVKRRVDFAVLILGDAPFDDPFGCPEAIERGLIPEDLLESTVDH